MKKLIKVLLISIILFTAIGCSSNNNNTHDYEPTPDAKEETPEFSIGICNYVDDASLNQIVDNITARLSALAEENNVIFHINTQNCNADTSVANQIVSDFISDKVDLMVGVATPVAQVMQAATEDNPIPVVFAAISDPIFAGLVDSLEKPGANLTGTSDYLDTAAIIRLITAYNPDIKKVGLLYDMGQDSSTTAIQAAKEILEELNIEVVERVGTNVSEIQLAASALIDDGVEAVFTPSDNTVMTAELSIYEAFAEAKIPHYTGADSFALNGAFLGYGVDYANLGVETADMIFDILVNGASVSDMPVKTFDNGTATVNTEICEAFGTTYEAVAEIFAPFCTKVQPIETSESFD